MVFSYSHIELFSYAELFLAAVLAGQFHHFFVFAAGRILYCCMSTLVPRGAYSTPGRPRSNRRIRIAFLRAETTAHTIEK
jgi:hypothetical protein